MSTVLVHRRARRAPPAVPRGELVVDPPPLLAEASGGSGPGPAATVLPMLAGTGSMAFLLTPKAGLAQLGAGGLLAGSMLAVTAAQVGRRSGDRDRRIDAARRDYLRYLGRLRRRLREAAAVQRSAERSAFPVPADLWTVPATPRLWERRPADADFGQVPVARGPGAPALGLVPPDLEPVEDRDPVCVGAVQRFLRAFRAVPDLPVPVGLCGFAVVQLSGEPAVARALARAMVAQLATFHAPGDVLLAAVVAPARRAEWDFLKWLPHALHPVECDGAGPVRLVADTVGELAQTLAPLLAGRPDSSAGSGPQTGGAPLPHLVVLVDAGEGAGGCDAADGEPRRADVAPLASRAGVTVLELAGPSAGAALRPGMLHLRVGPARATMRVLDPAGVEQVTSLGTPDALSVAEAMALARLLAPLRVAAADDRPGGAGRAGPAAGAGAPAPADPDALALLGLGDPHALDPERAWRPRPPREQLAVPFGVDPAGQPVVLDIKESASGGMGPHGLVVGATGSGKSELLRTLVLGFAATHPPDALNLVLVDFKGGATFLGLGRLPHVSAVVTNLAAELALVDRMRDALAGELTRRQELLRRAGGYPSRRDYEAARERGAPLDPLPSLWIVVDEFSELLTVRPELAELFGTVGRLGRSLGVHLLLAAQRLEEGRLRGLDAHLSYRIGLRTFSAGESRAVLGVAAAAELPREPGHGYLRSGTEPLRRFRAGYVGGPCPRRPSGAADGPAGFGVGERTVRSGSDGAGHDRPRIVAYTTHRVDPAPPGPVGWMPRHGRPGRAGARAAGSSGAAGGTVAVGEPGPAAGAAPAVVGAAGTAAVTVAPVAPVADPVAVGVAGTDLDPAGPSGPGGVVPGADLAAGAAGGPALAAEPDLLGVVVERLAGHGRPAHRVWLPPLDAPPTLDQLLPPLAVDPARGLTAADRPGRGPLRVPVAVVDRPYDQRRDPLWLDLSGGAGHLGIVGGPQSGKSTLLRTFVAALALTHPPSQAQVYALDFGGGALAGLAGLPHVGGVASRREPDAVRRTVAELTALVDSREAAFAAAGVDSAAGYRSARSAGDLPADRYAPDVFLLVDGWAGLRAEFAAQEPAITSLAARGLGFGVHVVATAGGWSEYRSGIRDLLQTRVELRLGDPYGSEVSRQLAAAVPADRPGRGLTADGLHLLTALPRIDGVGAAADLAGGTAKLVRQVAEAWAGPIAPAVRLLPQLLPASALPGPDPHTARTAVPIGVDEAALRPVFLDFADEPHLAVFGTTGSGKSNLLELVVRGVVARTAPREARLVVVDYRRALLGVVDPDHLVGYAPSSEAATVLLADVAVALRKRLPGPDLTADQLRTRGWWHGPELYVVVDDYELVATSAGNPLAVLVDLVGQAADVGLHLVLARGFGGVGRALYDPLIQRIRETGCPALVLSGDPEEGPVFGVRGEPLPAGRGTLTGRRHGPRAIQTAWVGGGAAGPPPAVPTPPG